MIKTIKQMDWRHWLRGLLAAFIGGGASAVSAGFSAAVIAPDTFNLSAGLNKTFSLMGICFVVNGVLTTCAYLKQSPVPTETEVQIDIPTDTHEKTVLP